jgi:hypothetical protein
MIKKGFANPILPSEHVLVNVFRARQFVKKFIRDCFVRGLCVEFVVLKILERLLETLFWFFCHRVDNVCWRCKKKFSFGGCFAMGYDVEFVVQLKMSKAFVGDLFSVISNACQ